MREHKVHKYYKEKFKTGTIIYKCAIEGCPHFVYEQLIIGRFCECYRCREDFVITRKSLSAKRLHCEDCTRGKYNKPKEKTVIVTENAAVIDEILMDINEAIELQAQQEQELENKGDQ